MGGDGHGSHGGGGGVVGGARWGGDKRVLRGGFGRLVFAMLECAGASLGNPIALNAAETSRRFGINSKVVDTLLGSRMSSSGSDCNMSKVRPLVARLVQPCMTSNFGPLQVGCVSPSDQLVAMVHRRLKLFHHAIKRPTRSRNCCFADLDHNALRGNEMNYVDIQKT